MNTADVKTQRIVRLCTIGAVIICVAAIALYVELISHDPYSWAVPGKESDSSRSLWLSRRALYGYVAGVSFVAAFGLALSSVVLNRLHHR